MSYVYKVTISKALSPVYMVERRNLTKTTAIEFEVVTDELYCVEDIIMNFLEDMEYQGKIVRYQNYAADEVVE